MILYDHVSSENKSIQLLYPDLRNTSSFLDHLYLSKKYPVNIYIPIWQYLFVYMLIPPTINDISMQYVCIFCKYNDICSILSITYVCNSVLYATFLCMWKHFDSIFSQWKIFKRRYKNKLLSLWMVNYVNPENCKFRCSSLGAWGYLNRSH